MLLGEIAPNASTTTQVPWYQGFLNTVAQLGAQYLTVEQQKDLMRIQTQRAAQGLPPLDVSEYTAGFSVGADRSTKTTALATATIVGAALVVAAIVSRR